MKTTWGSSRPESWAKDMLRSRTFNLEILCCDVFFHVTQKHYFDLFVFVWNWCNSDSSDYEF